MAIDNAYDAVNQQYPEEDEGVVGAISKVVGGAKELGVPIPPILAQFFTFLDSKSQQARQERGEAFIHLLVEDIQKHEAAIAKMRTEVHELQQSMSIALEYDVEEFNDLKRTRSIGKRRIISTIRRRFPPLTPDNPETLSLGTKLRFRNLILGL